ncbi:cobalamin-binding protein [marine bacterium AO1-C]|nr:cobalamin-binding protein [marine bacterium AO1-C]
MSLFIDQMQRQVKLPHTPKRIISLVPSQTELLFDLGLEERIVGVTKFCIHPKEKCKQKTKIGGTKKFNFDTIATLKPDLIIGNKEENYKEGIELLEQDYPVWMSDIFDLEDAQQMMQALGKITQTETQANHFIQQISQGFEHLDQLAANVKPMKVAYFIWRNPMMGVGSDTFIHEMIKRCGWQNVLENEARYPEITPEQLQTFNPDLILLSSEPYPFKDKHLREFQEICPSAKVILVDGEMFSWYGSRLRLAPDYFSELVQANQA